MCCSNLGYGQISVILSENCSKVVGTGSFDLTSTDSIDAYTQQPGWTGSKVYGSGNGVLKISSTTAKGYIVTPEINLLEGGDRISMSVSLAKVASTCDADINIYLDDNLIYTISKSSLTAQSQSFT
ncbi:MAG: hypothetical protein LBH34_02570, partial [Prevotellaceae bacterium]|nr:hypothetical protein [Prevotellaceae bacterium]